MSRILALRPGKQSSKLPLENDHRLFSGWLPAHKLHIKSVLMLHTFLKGAISVWSPSSPKSKGKESVLSHTFVVLIVTLSKQKKPSKREFVDIQTVQGNTPRQEENAHCQYHHHHQRCAFDF